MHGNISPEREFSLLRQSTGKLKGCIELLNVYRVILLRIPCYSWDRYNLSAVERVDGWNAFLKQSWCAVVAHFSGHLTRQKEGLERKNKQFMYCRFWNDARRNSLLACAELTCIMSIYLNRQIRPSVVFKKICCVYLYVCSCSAWNDISALWKYI